MNSIAGVGDPITRFVTAVFVLALAAAIPAFGTFAGSADGLDWWWVAGGSLVVAYIQGAFSVVRFRRARSEQVSHDEALFPVLLLVIGPAGSILAWLGGVLLANLIARRPPVKAMFNLGVFTLGAALGAGAALGVGGPSVEPVGIVATLAGTVVFALSMNLIFSGLMARLENQLWTMVAGPALVEELPKICLEILLGTLVAVAVTTTPAVAPLAVAALLTVTHAYRHWFRFDQDRKQLQDLLDAATGIQASTTVETAESSLTDAVYTLTAARSRVIHGSDPQHGGLVLHLEVADGTTWNLVVDRDEPLDDHDRSLVETLARIGSISFTNAVLFEERQETAQRLRKLVRSKEEFLLAFAHEIRTPLTVINGFTSLLSGSPPDPRLFPEASEHILEQTLEMTHLVDNLLVAARADSGETNLAPTLIDVGAELSRVIDTFPGHLRPNHPTTTLRCTSVADPIRVRQIIRNLILNALHHGGEDITVTAHSTHSEVSIEVRDDGSGIDEADIETIFEPFEHRHQIPGRPGSLGLGLSVSRLLARQMRGDVIYQRTNKHTTFTLHLPLADNVPSASYSANSPGTH